MEEALFKVLSFITFIMLGYLLRRLSILKAETFRVLSGIVFYITLPCIIITSINGVPVTSEMLSSLWARSAPSSWSPPATG